MLKRIFGILFLVLCAAAPHPAWAAGDPNDCEGCKDPALFIRMPGFFITEAQELDFDRLEFPTGSDRTQAVEGHYTYVNYYANDNIKYPSGLQIMANYINALKVYVVGHTDNVGAFEYNLKLSQARAAAVVDALVNQNGIASSRLTPFGAGPTSPVASNSSEEGRTKNRRVELVAQ